MKNQEKPKLNFSGHDTFPFRYTWLKKAVDGVLKNQTLFQDDQVMAELGVGKNMVNAIRHWSVLIGLLKESEQRGYYVTELGNKLFADDGWDPYLEDAATLWLIHWKLCTDFVNATTWYYAFNRVTSIEFTKEQLLEELFEIAGKNETKVTLNTLSRDVDCFIRSYVPSKYSKSVLLEDNLDCPLSELSLIHEAGQRGLYMFMRSPKPDLPDSVFIYALLDFWRRSHKENVLSFDDIAYQEGSPGLIFKLDEDTLTYRLELLEKITNGKIRFDETSNLRQIYRHEEIDPISFLDKYYQKTTKQMVGS